MPILRNPMKEGLLAREPMLGVSVMIPSPQIVEMIGELGFDWVLLDCEHGTIDLESLELMAIAARAAGITPIARPATKDPAQISRVMDRGVLGVQVPHVMDADDARRAVEAVKFHPLGSRGLAAGTRAAMYDYAGGLDEFVKASNDATLVCVQIEDEDALPYAEDIATVKGVDVVFVGPSDLSQSMGYPGAPNMPEVAEAIDDVVQAALAAGKAAGLPAGSGAIAETLGQGIRYTYTHFTKLFATGARDHLAKARKTPAVTPFPGGRDQAASRK